MSLSIDELSSMYGLTGVNGVTQSKAQNTSEDLEKKATDGDSYISTIAMMDTTKAIPSENYNDLAKMIKSASKTASSVSATEYGTVDTSASGSAVTGISEDEDAVNASAGILTSDTTSETSASGQASGAAASGGAGGSGGGSDDSDEETETEVVTIDGQTYLQTTTTDADGNTTVTRVPIGSAPVQDENGEATGTASGTMSAAAQAIAEL